MRDQELLAVVKFCRQTLVMRVRWEIVPLPIEEHGDLPFLLALCKTYTDSLPFLKFRGESMFRFCLLICLFRIWI